MGYILGLLILIASGVGFYYHLCQKNTIPEFSIKSWFISLLLVIGLYLGFTLPFTQHDADHPCLKKVVENNIRHCVEWK